MKLLLFHTGQSWQKIILSTSLLAQHKLAEFDISHQLEETDLEEQHFSL